MNQTTNTQHEPAQYQVQTTSPSHVIPGVPDKEIVDTSDKIALVEALEEKDQNLLFQLLDGYPDTKRCGKYRIKLTKNQPYVISDDPTDAISSLGRVEKVTAAMAEIRVKAQRLLKATERTNQEKEVSSPAGALPVSPNDPISSTIGNIPLPGNSLRSNNPETGVSKHGLLPVDVNGPVSCPVGNVSSSTVPTSAKVDQLVSGGVKQSSSETGFSKQAVTPPLNAIDAVSGIARQTSSETGISSLCNAAAPVSENKSDDPAIQFRWIGTSASKWKRFLSPYVIRPWILVLAILVNAMALAYLSHRTSIAETRAEVLEKGVVASLNAIDVLRSQNAVHDKAGH